jgi:hypothetical protein
LSRQNYSNLHSLAVLEEPRLGLLVIGRTALDARAGVLRLQVEDLHRVGIDGELFVDRESERDATAISCADPLDGRVVLGVDEVDLPPVGRLDADRIAPVDLQARLATALAVELRVLGVPSAPRRTEAPRRRRRLAQVALPQGDDEVDGVDPETMTREQCAAYRALLERALAEAEAAKSSPLATECVRPFAERGCHFTAAEVIRVENPGQSGDPLPASRLRQATRGTGSQCTPPTCTPSHPSK